MNKEKEKLIKYQRENFKPLELSDSFQGFDRRAYPETAIDEDLLNIGKVVGVSRGGFSEEGFRENILSKLSVEDPEDS